MSENLIDQIYKEIQKTGYPTELMVNRIFRLRSWVCTENQYYIDQDENKGREIDLLAHNNVYDSEPKICFNIILSYERISLLILNV